MKNHCEWLCLLIPAAFGLIFFQSCGPAGRVQVEQGALTGTRGNDRSIIVYKGIPYASPPVGNLRWQPPRPPKAWKGVFSADTFPPACPQNLERSHLPWTGEFMHQEEADEDCLYLNIWTGAMPESEKRPVMVYIHGGAFTSGSNSVAVYNGESLAKKGVLVVTVNYRLGALGFLAHPELTRESDHRASGNYGLLDQAAALWWIHENISVFGGDPGNVTIFGQSAGAMSVAMLMESPLSKELFARSIIQSGPGLFPDEFLNSETGLPAAERAGQRFAETKGALSLADLRALPAESLLDIPQEISIGPIRDGWFLPKNMQSSSRVPVMNGLTADDIGAGGNYGPAPESTLQAYREEARRLYGNRAQKYLSLYPAASDADIPARRKDSGRDKARVSLYLWASRQAGIRDNVYTYYFDRAIPWPEHPEFGSFHSGELPYVFDNLRLLDRPWEEVDHTLAGQMSTYWVNFAQNGNPNGPGLPEWPRFDPAEEETMELGSKMGAIPVATPERLAFWKTTLSRD